MLSKCFPVPIENYILAKNIYESPLQHQHIFQYDSQKCTYVLEKHYQHFLEVKVISYIILEYYNEWFCCPERPLEALLVSVTDLRQEKAEADPFFRMWLQHRPDLVGLVDIHHHPKLFDLAKHHRHLNLKLVGHPIDDDPNDLVVAAVQNERQPRNTATLRPENLMALDSERILREAVGAFG